MATYFRIIGTKSTRHKKTIEFNYCIFNSSDCLNTMGVLSTVCLISVLHNGFKVLPLQPIVAESWAQSQQLTTKLWNCNYCIIIPL